MYMVILLPVPPITPRACAAPAPKRGQGEVGGRGRGESEWLCGRGDGWQGVGHWMRHVANTLCPVARSGEEVNENMPSKQENVTQHFKTFLYDSYYGQMLYNV